MRKIIYLQPHVIVHMIRPEELMQGIGVNSDPDSGIPGDDADAKYHSDIEDDEDSSYNIWED